jgi:hypothetical protein
MKGTMDVYGGDARLHTEYVWIWVAHQLVPFADKVLGIAGAMDNRPLFRADWIYRLPFVALALLFPKRKDARRRVCAPRKRRGGRPSKGRRAHVLCRGGARGRGPRRS